ncbi:MAG TPA: hypothetical protein VKA85_03960 [Candidatus Limnocylindrales bacterium]|nr:hypothetical protein [Candidatus Limnocylindrales bacterium]
MDTRTVDSLQAKVQRARWRVRMATVGSPEWDAAVTGLEELEAELARLTKQRRLSGTG